MLDDNESFIAIYDSLVEQHGCMSPSDLAICRSMAVLLTEDPSEDPVIKAKTANNLAALLPPRKEPVKVSEIKVELVNPNGEVVPWPQERQAEIAALKARIVELEARLAEFEAVSCALPITAAFFLPEVELSLGVPRSARDAKTDRGE